MKYEFEFNITSFCQAKCASCVRTINIDKFTPAHYPLENFAETIKNLHSVKPTVITLCGEWGDPMMHPEIEGFIELASKNYRVEIMTNGGLRNPDFYEHLAKTYKNLRICFCIDGLDHNTNWLYREGVDWKKAWDNMHAYFGSGGQGQWEFICFTWNEHQMEDAHKYAKDHGIDIVVKLNKRPDFPGLLYGKRKENVIERINALH